MIEYDTQMVSVAVGVVSAFVPFLVVLASVVLILYFTLHRKTCCCQPNQVKPEVNGGIHRNLEKGCPGDEIGHVAVIGDDQPIAAEKGDGEIEKFELIGQAGDDGEQHATETEVRKGSFEKNAGITQAAEATSIIIDRTEVQSVEISIPDFDLNRKEDDATSVSSGTSTSSGSSYTSSDSCTTYQSRVDIIQSPERENSGKVLTPVESFLPDPTCLPSTSGFQENRTCNSKTFRNSSTSSYSYSSGTQSESGSSTFTDSSPDSSWESDASSGSLTSVESFRKSTKNFSRKIDKHVENDHDLQEKQASECLSVKSPKTSPKTNLKENFSAEKPLATSSGVSVAHSVPRDKQRTNILNDDSISAVLDDFEQTFESELCSKKSGSVLIQNDEACENKPLRTSEVHLPKIHTSEDCTGSYPMKAVPIEEDMFQAGAYENIAKLSRIEPDDQAAEEVTIIPPLRLHQAVVPLQTALPLEIDPAEPEVVTPTTPALPKFRQLSLNNKPVELPPVTSKSVPPDQSAGKVHNVDIPDVTPFTQATHDGIPVRIRNICITNIPVSDQVAPPDRKDQEPKTEQPVKIEKDIPSESDQYSDRLSGTCDDVLLPKVEPLLNRPKTDPKKLASSESGDFHGIPNFNIEERAAVEQLRNKLRQRERLKIAHQMMEEDKIKSRKNWENSLLNGTGTDTKSEVAPHPPKETKPHRHRHQHSSGDKNGHRRRNSTDKNGYRQRKNKGEKCAQDQLVLKKLGRNMRARDRQLHTPLSASERTAADRSKELLKLLNRKQKVTEHGKPTSQFTYQSADQDDVKTVLSDSAQPASMSTNHDTKPRRKKHRKQLPMLKTPFDSSTKQEELVEDRLNSHRSELSIASDTAVDRLISKGSLVNTKQMTSLPSHITKEFLP